MAALAAMLAVLTPPALHGAELGVARQAAQSLPDQGRVIVKYRADASVLSASTLSTAQSSRGAIQGVQAASRMGARLGLTLTDGRALGARTQVLKSASLGSQALAKRLAQDSNVEWAVVDGRRFITAVPNDPLYPEGLAATVNNLTAGQWYLRAPTSTYVSAINASGAWSVTEGSSSVVVAVLDTGIRPEHPDLAGKLLSGHDFVSDTVIANDGDGRDSDPTDPGDWVTPAESGDTNSVLSGCTVESSSWHGTHVAGIIGAATDNGIGMAGIAPNVMVLPVRVLGKCGGYDSDIIAGMQWAAGLSVPGVTSNSHPAKVLNLSLGSAGSCTSAYADAVSAINAAGAVVVAAAGNDSLAVNTPGNCSGVIAVGGLHHAGTKAWYSSLGSAVALSAPGGNCGTGPLCQYGILTATNAGTTSAGTSSYTNATDYAIGTSFAAPMVSGTAALMFSTNSSLSPATIRSLLQASARAFPTTGAEDRTATSCHASDGVTTQEECYCTTSTCGAGMLDSATAVAAAAAVLPPTASIALASASVPAGSTVTLDGRGSSAVSDASIVSYAWSITEGSSLASFSGGTTGSTASLVTTGAGTVTVTLTVTDSHGLSASTAQTLTVTAAFSGGGGGGGAMALWWQAGLLALGLLLRRRSV
ncbi:S8 family peptidase [Ideonella sp. B7]|nr:S8 family peptidase [Ideonella benzenivorans]